MGPRCQETVATSRSGKASSAADASRTIPGVSIRAPSMQTMIPAAVVASTAALMAGAGDEPLGNRISRVFGPAAAPQASLSGGSEPTSTAITS